MKFLHTADWQIGMKAESLGDAGRRVRDERLEAGRRLVNMANTEGAAFILVAGDLFEDNAVDRSLIQKTADILARFHGPVYIIPGNHDPWVPGCVWEHPSWRSAKNLKVLTEETPVEISGGLLYPCPIRDKYSTKDPTAWIRTERGKGICVGMAHGNVEGLPQGEPDHPIARNAADRAGLDYLALGHWHSTTPYPCSDSAVRMAYSGTPETTGFGERDSGNALMIDIEAPGAAPKLTSVRTGGLRWQSLDWDVREPGDIKRIRQELEESPDPDSLLLKVCLNGFLYSDERGELSHLEDLCASNRFLSARLDSSALLPSPEDQNWIEALPPGILREAAGSLRQTSLSGGKEAETASRALLELYALASEVTR